MDIIIFTFAAIVSLYFFGSIFTSDPNEIRFLGTTPAPVGDEGGR
jgi:hypothetical protein